MPNITQITPPRVPIVNDKTGYMSREWYRYFYNLYYATGGENGGAVPVPRGGTGTTVIPTDGQLLIGNDTTKAYTVANLGTGAGIAKTVGAGSLSIENTGVLSNIAGTGISVNQPTGNVTITNTGVLSVIAGTGISVNQPTGNVTITNTGVTSFSGGSTGLTPATATTGAVTLAGTLDVDNGGTGATDAAGARTNLGLGTMATQNIGASGSFTTADSKTVTVVNGIITSIV